MDYKNLTIIGTNHIAKQSLSEVRDIITQKNPDIIAVELDKGRLPIILDRSKRKISLSIIPKIGLKGFIFSIIGEYVEKKMGSYTGVMPGEEMATAVRIAKEKQIRLALIDQDITITLKRFSKEITWKEKFQFVKDIFSALFFWVTKKKPNLPFDVSKFDINKVPSEELIENMISEVQKRYPNVHKTLISERDEFMAKRLGSIIQRFPDSKIVAVVGAGHAKSIIKILRSKEKQSLSSYSFNFQTSI